VMWFNRLTIHQVLQSNAAVILLTILLYVIFSTRVSYETNMDSLFTIPQSPIVEEVITKAFIQRSYPDRMTIYLTKNELTERYQYHTIPLESIRQWLENKNSILAEEPYLSTIVETAYQYNIHPFLLLAITGHEQAFVPSSNRKAAEIANNPFNVYHSWKEYNTDIADSARIAAKTIVRLAEGRPQGVNPLKWINRKYAEDTNWHIGVETFFKQMLLQIDSESNIQN
jgi:hypothetical protein